MRRLSTALAVGLLTLASALSFQVRDHAFATAFPDFPAQEVLTQSLPARENTSYAQVRPLIRVLRPDYLPEQFRSGVWQDREADWNTWVVTQDASIRARIDRGDEDSIANLALFGTAFTSAPRITEDDLNEAFTKKVLPRGADRRINDLIAGAAAPRGNERLAFAAEVLGRDAIRLDVESGRSQARRWLTDVIGRVVAEYFTSLPARGTVDDAARLVQGVTQFRDRGLSSDTQLDVNFALQETLGRLVQAGHLKKNSVTRVGIVGPGLDFADKREGYDFYPQQTIQPFGLIESLMRLELVAPERFSVTTFDLSPRVNIHLEAARQAARAGTRYVLHLPRGMTTYEWHPALLTFWRDFGNRVGQPTRPAEPPAQFQDIEARALTVDPEVVLSIVPRDVNVVVQRLAVSPESGGFDVIVATNILVYYSVFEQVLALSNVASMLRPGGLLLSNTLPFLVPGHPLDLIGFTDVVYNNRPSTDRIFWARKQ